MLDMLKQIGRQEMVVGWYHSHPGKLSFSSNFIGFGPWLSGVDMNTQQVSRLSKNNFLRVLKCLIQERLLLWWTQSKV
jgi:26S proteasome regulatory subunit N11